MFSTDTWLRIVCSILVNPILFGIGVVTVLSVPVLSEHAKYLIPAVVAASFALAPIIGSMIAPRLRIRTWGREGWVSGDAVSG